MKKPVLVVMAGALLCTLLVGAMWLYFNKSTEEIGRQEAAAQEKYNRHYVLIVEDPASNLWQEIYESASARAEESNAYLELLDSDAADEQTLEDFLRISIAAKVDGIIMQPDGSEEVRDLIDEAWEAGIPVVTALVDDSDSERISFVGINSYQMGTAYADAIMKNLKKDDSNVLVLAGEDAQETGTDLVLLQLMNELKQKDKSVNVSSYYMNTFGSFELEEAVRDIFVRQEELPNMLVCLNEMITECAYQTLIDYNQVGNVDIIGYYESDTILDAIKKRTISGTISFNTDEIGRYSVEALNEYDSLGHVSNYFNVTLRTIEADNVAGTMAAQQ